MAGSTVTQIRKGIAANLKDAFGEDVQVLHNPRAIFTPPCVWVIRDGSEQFTNDGGTILYRFRLQALVGLGTDEGAQDLLDQFCDPEGARSIQAALDADSTLGGVAEDLYVGNPGPDQLFVKEQGTVASQYLGVEFPVEVYAPGR